MDIVDRARLSLEAHHASPPDATDQAPHAEEQTPPENVPPNAEQTPPETVPPAQQGGDGL